MEKIFNLQLHAEGAGTSEGTTSGVAPQKGDTVIYGKSDASSEVNDKSPVAEGIVTTEVSPEEKKKKYQDLIRGEYKTEHDEETQRIFNKRFKDYKELQQRNAELNTLAEMLGTKYGVDVANVADITKAIESDDSYWATAADEAGMTIQQYKEWSKMKRENEAFRKVQEQAREKEKVDSQVQDWIRQADEFKKVFPDFDMQKETDNPQFLNMLKAGVPVEHAYKVLHMDEIQNATIQVTAQNVQNAVVNNIRAKGSRPTENGLTNQGAAIVKDDVSKLSKKDRAEIANRVKRGDNIVF